MDQGVWWCLSTDSILEVVLMVAVQEDVGLLEVVLVTAMMTVAGDVDGCEDVGLGHEICVEFAALGVMYAVLVPVVRAVVRVILLAAARSGLRPARFLSWYMSGASVVLAVVDVRLELVLNGWTCYCYSPHSSC